MRLILALIALLLLHSTLAHANIVCTRVGSTTVCNDSSNGGRIACTRVGDTTVCN